MWKAMIRPNLLKIVFAIAIILTTIINLNANEAEKERLNSWIKARKEILAELDSLIAKGIPIDFGKMGLEAWEHTMDGGIRQIEFYYKFMTNGTKLTQKLGIDGVSKWWYKPKGGLSPKDVEWYKMAGQYTVTDADSLYFNKYKPIIIKKLYEFLNDENPLIQVAAAQSLIRMHITDPLIINKLKYYANRKNIKLWSHKINLDLYELYSKERTNEKAINILIRRAKNGLKKLNKNQEQYNLNKKTIKNLKRDLDWNGDISASYCIEWYGGEDPDNPIYNPSYTSYSADCCNFASQCLIAGYYDDIIPASASYPPDHVSPQGCITWCPDLHDYLSNRFDVVTTVVDFHTNGWENGTEPNNHIPDNFSVGDIAIVGFHVDGSGPYQGHYKHAIICHGYDGNGYELFGAHTTNNIDKTMTWFIYPDTTKWDYATFYHITNNWNCNTQIAGGAVSGTWTHENSPYCINGEITIPQGSQLTIEPGVNVIFTGHYKFNIYGRLVAEGDWQRYINFIPQNSFIGWHGLRFFDQNSNGQDISKVVYCKLQYGNAFGTSPDCNGGAIYLDNSDILIDNCIISNNTVIGGGGGVFIYNSSDPTIKRSIIRDNTSEAAGGGIYIWDNCTPTLENVCIYNNEAVSEAFGRGGGIYCDNWCFPILTNVTFSLNTANYNSPYPGGGLFSCNNSYPTLLNCILWHDIPQEIGEGYSRVVTVTYSDVEGGTPGEGNIDADPLFADPSNGDFQITWANYPVIDSTKSPCIDTGSLSLPLDPDSTIADMGAYYFHQYETGPSAPQNVTVYIDADSVYLTWSVTRHRNTYKVYSSNHPYSDFEEDLTGTYNETSWTAPLPTADDKKFYYVTSVN